MEQIKESEIFPIVNEVLIHDRDDFDGNSLVSRGNFWKIRQNRFEARLIGGRRDFLREFVPEFSENIR